MKLCIFCKNCLFEEGYAYSEYTYADKRIGCYGGYNEVSYNAPFNSQEEFNTWNRFAEKCHKYESEG